MFMMINLHQNFKNYLQCKFAKLICPFKLIQVYFKLIVNLFLDFLISFITTDFIQLFF